jgi:hypothetical protein
MIAACSDSFGEAEGGQGCSAVAGDVAQGGGDFGTESWRWTSFTITSNSWTAFTQLISSLGS